MSAPLSKAPSHLEVPAGPTTPAASRPRPPVPISRTTTAQRLPPPTLFQGPPSKNASHIDLALPADIRHGPNDQGESARSPNPRASRVPPAATFSGPALRQPPASKPDAFQAESLWAEMQKTLSDVELSAANPSHVFGASHATALEELRQAQLHLAQAWAKSEADEIHDLDADAEEAISAAKTEVTPTTAKRDGKGGAAGVKSAFSNNKNLEDETERDIQLARKRREANDRYFEQVNRGVVDVVGKLDVVAGAMRRVEKETKEIWEGSSSGEGGSGSGEEVDSVVDAVDDGELSPSLLSASLSASPQSTRSPQSRRER